MILLKKNRYHAAGISGVILLFIFSVLVRKENLSAPLANPQEWITAHTLITCEIWAENGGPSAYHFSPVYTYPGEGNRQRQLLGGVIDDKGDVYYVSYPPFSFLFAYYTSLCFGGPDVLFIRILSLGIHLFCAVMLYLIALKLKPADDRLGISIAGLMAAFLYLFSAGNLWVHGNLYFADILVQPMVIWMLYLIICFIKKNYVKEVRMIIGLSVLCFLATYTEWLGLLFSFTIGITCLILFFVKKEKRFLRAFFAVGTASVLALILTVFQYSSIAGADQLKEVSIAKYEERSGRSHLLQNEFTLDNPNAYSFMKEKIDYNYRMAENFVMILTGLFLLLIFFPAIRKRMQTNYAVVLFFIPVLAAIGLHYLVFFNFNAQHDFASFKAGLVFILICLVLLSVIESGLIFKWRILLFGSVFILAVFQGINSVTDYHKKFKTEDVDRNRINTAAAIQTYGSPDKGVFTNIFCNPELIYLSKHNVFPLSDSTRLKDLMIYFNNDQGQYYHHDASELSYIQEFVLVNETLIFTDRINLQGTNQH